MMAEAFDTDRLTKSYGKFLALDSLDVRGYQT